VLFDFDFHFDSVLLELAFGVHNISYLLFHCILFSLHSVNVSGYSAASVKIKTSMYKHAIICVVTSKMINIWQTKLIFIKAV